MYLARLFNHTDVIAYIICDCFFWFEYSHVRIQLKRINGISFVIMYKGKLTLWEPVQNILLPISVALYMKAIPFFFKRNAGKLVKLPFKFLFGIPFKPLESYNLYLIKSRPYLKYISPNIRLSLPVVRHRYDLDIREIPKHKSDRRVARMFCKYPYLAILLRILAHYPMG